VGQGPGGSNYTYGNKPVVYVSWYDSIRFANWLHNGQGSGDTTGNASYPMTDAGSYALSDSPYGTFDQGGNVMEWNEALISSSARGLRGGDWGNGYWLSSVWSFDDPSGEGALNGFRVASIPEPSTLPSSACVRCVRWWEAFLSTRGICNLAAMRSSRRMHKSSLTESLSQLPAFAILMLHWPALPAVAGR